MEFSSLDSAEFAGSPGSVCAQCQGSDLAVAAELGWGVAVEGCAFWERDWEGTVDLLWISTWNVSESELGCVMSESRLGGSAPRAVWL